MANLIFLPVAKAIESGCTSSTTALGTGGMLVARMPTRFVTAGELSLVIFLGGLCAAAEPLSWLLNPALDLAQLSLQRLYGDRGFFLGLPPGGGGAIVGIAFGIGQRLRLGLARSCRFLVDLPAIGAIPNRSHPAAPGAKDGISPDDLGLAQTTLAGKDRVFGLRISRPDRVHGLGKLGVPSDGRLTNSMLVGDLLGGLAFSQVLILSTWGNAGVFEPFGVAVSSLRVEIIEPDVVGSLLVRVVPAGKLVVEQPLFCRLAGREAEILDLVLDPESLADG